MAIALAKAGVRDLDSEGVNRSLWPASTVSFWRRTRRARPADFILEGAAS